MREVRLALLCSEEFAFTLLWGRQFISVGVVLCMYIRESVCVFCFCSLPALFRRLSLEKQNETAEHGSLKTDFRRETAGEKSVSFSPVSPNTQASAGGSTTTDKNKKAPPHASACVWGCRTMSTFCASDFLDFSPQPRPHFWETAEKSSPKKRIHSNACVRAH